MIATDQKPDDAAKTLSACGEIDALVQSGEVVAQAQLLVNVAANREAPAYVRMRALSAYLEIGRWLSQRLTGDLPDGSDDQRAAFDRLPASWLPAKLDPENSEPQ